MPRTAPKRPRAASDHAAQDSTPLQSSTHGPPQKKQKLESSPAEEDEEFELSSPESARDDLSEKACCNWNVVELSRYLKETSLPKERRINNVSSTLVARSAPDMDNLIYGVALKCIRCSNDLTYVILDPPRSERQYRGHVEPHPPAADLKMSHKALIKRLKTLGVICPSCDELNGANRRQTHRVDVYPDGFPMTIHPTRTVAQCAVTMESLLKACFRDDHIILGRLQHLKRVDRPIWELDTNCFDGLHRLHIFFKGSKAETDALMRVQDKLSRDPELNKIMVAKSDGLWMQSSFVPEIALENTGKRNYESTRAVEMIIKNRPHHILERHETFFTVAPLFTNQGCGLANVSADRKLYYMATKNRSSGTRQAKIEVEGFDVADGYILGEPQTRYYYEPMAPCQGRILPEWKDYIKGYMSALKIYHDKTMMGMLKSSNLSPDAASERYIEGFTDGMKNISEAHSASGGGSQETIELSVEDGMMRVTAREAQDTLAMLCSATESSDQTAAEDKSLSDVTASGSETVESRTTISPDSPKLDCQQSGDTVAPESSIDPAEAHEATNDARKILVECPSSSQKIAGPAFCTPTSPPMTAATVPPDHKPVPQLNLPANASSTDPTIGLDGLGPVTPPSDPRLRNRGIGFPVSANSPSQRGMRGTDKLRIGTTDTPKGTAAGKKAPVLGKTRVTTALLNMRPLPTE